MTVPGHHVEWYPSIGSTMVFAADRARHGCPHGTIIGADEQTAGIGRHGHSWISSAGAGLYVSFVLRLPMPAPVVTLALGLATREAIVHTTHLDPDLRWPNDVLIDGRKAAGILAQLEGDAIIAGIGINVSQESFPSDLETPATSLAMQGASVSREDLLIALAQSVDEYCRVLTEDGTGAILRTFEASSSYAQGRRVQVDQGDRKIVGMTEGLDPSGFLRVREDNGRETTILAGGVRPL